MMNNPNQLSVSLELLKDQLSSLEREIEIQLDQKKRPHLTLSLEQIKDFLSILDFKLTKIDRKNQNNQVPLEQILLEMLLRLLPYLKPQKQFFHSLLECLENFTKTHLNQKLSRQEDLNLFFLLKSFENHILTFIHRDGISLNRSELDPFRNLLLLGGSVLYSPDTFEEVLSLIEALGPKHQFSLKSEIKSAQIGIMKRLYHKKWRQSHQHLKKIQRFPHNLG